MVRESDRAQPGFAGPRSGGAFRRAVLGARCIRVTRSVVTVGSVRVAVQMAFHDQLAFVGIRTAKVIARKRSGLASCAVRRWCWD